MPKRSDIQSILIIGTIMLCYFSANNCYAKENFDIDAWPTWKVATPNVFACAVEKKTGIKTPNYSCAGISADKNYQKKLDKEGTNPCNGTNVNWNGPWQGDESPIFPLSLIRMIHPKATGIWFEWAHQNLAGFSVELDKHYASPDEVLSQVIVPKNMERPSMDVQHCSQDHDCLNVTFFLDMGAADLDCSYDSITKKQK